MLLELGLVQQKLQAQAQQREQLAREPQEQQEQQGLRARQEVRER